MTPEQFAALMLMLEGIRTALVAGAIGRRTVSHDTNFWAQLAASNEQAARALTFAAKEEA